MTIVNFAGKWRAKTSSFWDDSTKDSEATKTWRDDALCAWHSFGGIQTKIHVSFFIDITRDVMSQRIILKVDPIVLSLFFHGRPQSLI